MALTEKEKQQLGIEAGRVFSPAAPIDEQALFAGRTDQLRQVIDAVNQRGQHAIIFGERGVGKTSLANVLSAFLGAAGEQVLSPHVNCDGTDTFGSLWRKIFSHIQISDQARRTAGFHSKNAKQAETLAEKMPKEVTPDQVQTALAAISNQRVVIVIVDEFDRLGNGGARKLFADTIKTLSDHSVRAVSPRIFWTLN